MLFEGRDAAGKGGTIAPTSRISIRAIRHSVALPKPSDREHTQWYFQRYVDWLPAAGEQVLFDRSWYNRAGRRAGDGVLHTRADDQVPRRGRRTSSGMLVNDGIHLFKFWLSIGREMQMKRFHDRRARSAQALETVAGRLRGARQVRRLLRSAHTHVQARPTPIMRRGPSFSPTTSGAAALAVIRACCGRSTTRQGPRRDRPRRREDHSRSRAVPPHARRHLISPRTVLR